MCGHALPRILLAGFTLALVAAGALNASALAKNTVDWPVTTSREKALVQSCAGFDITSSYTIGSNDQVVENYTGRVAFERSNVTFSGAVVNVTNGLGFGYDGKFVRIKDISRGVTWIDDFEIRLNLPNREETTVTVERLNHDLIGNPPDVLREFAPAGLRDGLCDLLGSAPGALR